MDNLFGPGRTRSSRSPQPLNNFQQELAAKMKDRKRRGLTSDLTPSASERASDEELASDDDLMAQFNMTNKKKSKTWNPPGFGNASQDRSSPASNRSKSPYDSLRRSPASDLIFGKKTPTAFPDEEEDDSDLDGPSNLMMTMKKPLNPSSFGSKTLPNPKQRKSKAFDHLNEDSSSRDKKEKTWTPPSFKQSTDEEKENRPQRPKSPNVRGRKTPNLSLDSIEEESRPTPKTRFKMDEDDNDFRRPQPKPRGRASPARGYHDSDDEDEEIRRYTDRRASPLDYSSAKKSSNKDGRKTPSDNRRTPSFDGRKTPSDGRKTPTDGRKTPTEGRRTPSDSKINIFGRQTPDRRSSVDDRSTPDRRTPVEKGRRTPVDGRRTPNEGRSTGKHSKKGEPEPVQRKSVLDMFSAQGSKTPPKKSGAKKVEKKSYLRDSSSEDEGMGAPRRTPSPAVRGRKTPDRLGDGQRGRSTFSLQHDHGDDDVDGMRLRPSQQRNSRNRDDGPSLRGGSPQRELSRSPYGDQIRPSLRGEVPDEDEGRHSAFRPTPASRSQRQDQTQTERGRPRSRGPHDERESSVCRDVEKDPNMRRQQDNIKEKKLAKTHTSEGRKLEDAIVSVENAQDKTMKFIAPDDDKETMEKEKTSHPVTPKSQRHRPKPRYAKPSPKTAPAAATYNFNSTEDIKQAVYESWYQERQKSAREQRKQQQRAEREALEKKKKDEEDKFITAKASYQAWMESKKDFDRERREKRRKEEEQKANQQHEELDKKKDAQKSYKMWKENKDAKLRENQHKKQKEEERKRRDEEDEKNMKKKHSENAFDGWKKQKDNRLLQDSAKQRRDKTQKQEKELEEQREREEAALDSYDKWIHHKEKQQFRETRNTHRRTATEPESKPAWSPASRTIPVGR